MVTAWGGAEGTAREEERRGGRNGGVEKKRREGRRGGGEEEEGRKRGLRGRRNVEGEQGREEEGTKGHLKIQHKKNSWILSFQQTLIFEAGLLYFRDTIKNTFCNYFPANPQCWLSKFHKDKFHKSFFSKHTKRFRSWLIKLANLASQQTHNVSEAG